MTFVLVLGLALLCGATMRAQSIVGHIETPAGVPIVGVLVTGTRTLPFQRVTDTTDPSGNYALSGGLGGLSGTYNVVPSKSGYSFTPASTNVTVSGRDATANFTTPASVPVAYTDFYSVSPVNATSERLTAQVNPDGAATTAWFEYGLTTNYGGVSATTNLGSGIYYFTFSMTVTGLLRSNSYYFRVVASNSFGLAASNPNLGFFYTESGIPNVSTLDPTGGSATSMTLNGSVFPGGADATAWFEWGTTTNYGNVTPAQSLTTNINGNNFFSQPLTGLATATSHHYRAVAATSYGTNFGADVLFTPLFNDIAAALPGVWVSSVAWGDYDFDGRLDILLTGQSSTGRIAQVWRNTGAGFVDINAGLPGVVFGSVAWGDFNADGWLDILLTGSTNGSDSGAIAQVWRNTGNGFVNVGAGLPGVWQGSVAWSDYDNDGRLDILLTGLTSTGPIAQVWRNTGSGFVNINAGLPGVSLGSAAWGDYDNDGGLDILLTGTTNGSDSGAIAQVWRNTGNGFSNINASLPAVFHSSAAWGDYDNDGRSDILLTGYPEPFPPLWRNTVTGFVGVSIFPFRATDYGSVAWGDFDNDSWLDILLSGYGSGGELAQVWRNTGTGFVNMNVGLPGVEYSSVAWGDYDNDGRLDILLTGRHESGPTQVAQIWRNNTLLPDNPPDPPTGLAAAASGTAVTLSWSAASDSQSPSAGLTYNLRVGAAPGGQDIVSPMASATGFRRLPQMGNAQERLSATVAPIQLGRTYFWSVQAIDTAFAGSAFAAEQTFTINTVVTPPNGIPVSGGINGDGVVDQGEFAAVLQNLNGNGTVSQSELDLVLSNYWPYSPWLYMTNVAGLGGTNVTFALTNSLAGAFSVEFTTNLMDWLFLGPAFPVYQFLDPMATNDPMRYYRLRWP